MVTWDLQNRAASSDVDVEMTWVAPKLRASRFNPHLQFKLPVLRASKSLGEVVPGWGGHLRRLRLATGVWLVAATPRGVGGRGVGVAMGP